MPSIVSAVPNIVNLHLYAGDDVSVNVNITTPDGQPVDLSDMTAKAQIREGDDPPVDFATTVNPAGTVTLTLTATQTAALPEFARWDCQMTSAAGTVFTVAAGQVYVRGDVTK